MTYLVVAGISFGSIGIFVNFIGDQISTLLVVSIRLLTTAAIIYLFQTFKGTTQKLLLNSWVEFFIAVIGGLLGFATTFGLYLKSLLLVPISEAVFLHYVAFPFTTIVYSLIVLGEKVSRVELISLFCTISGVFLIYNVGFMSGESSFLGYSLAFLSGITYSAVLLALKKLRKSKTTLQALFWPLLTGGIASLPVALISEANFEFSLNAIAPLIGLIMISSLLGYSLFAKGVKRTKAGLSSIIMIIVEPLSATLLATIFLGENISIFTGLGGGLVVFSGVLLYVAGPDSIGRKVITN